MGTPPSSDTCTPSSPATTSSTDQSLSFSSTASQTNPSSPSLRTWSKTSESPLPYPHALHACAVGCLGKTRPTTTSASSQPSTSPSFSAATSSTPSCREFELHIVFACVHREDGVDVRVGLVVFKRRVDHVDL